MLSIIIVNYRTSGDVAKCLDSIVRYEPRCREYEIIIVDNNSDDPGLKAIGETFPFVKILYAPENGGFSYGNNIGLNNSSGDYILLLNPDTYLRDNAIEKLYDRIRNDPGIHIIGPKLLNADGSNQSISVPKTYLTPWNLLCSQLYLNRIFRHSRIFNSYYQTYMDYENEAYVEQVSGAVFLFRKSVLDAIGMLDEHYFMYYEESDFCLQAIKKGMKQLYYPKSEVVHTGQTSTTDIPEWAVNTFSDSFIFYFKKNFNAFSKWTAIGFLLLGSSIRMIIYFLAFNRKYKFYFYYVRTILLKISRGQVAGRA